MEYRKLGSTGTEVSELCFGTWRFGKETDGVVETDYETAHDLLDAFAEAGGNFIDTANVYGNPSGKSERWIGDWLEERDREDYVIASKVRGQVRDGPNGGGVGRKHVRAEVENTLDRLGTDYLDVYYVHWWDPETPIEETLRTMDRLVAEGKVHHLAISNTPAWQLVDSLWTSDREGLERFEITQPKFNAAFRERPAEFLDACAEYDLAVCPYSPLEAGFLTGKYERTAEGIDAPEGSRADLEDWDDRWDDRQWDVLGEIREIADEEDATPTQVALRWLIEQERFTCVPIIGARTVEQLEESLGATETSLSGAQFDRITEAYEDDD